MTSNSSLRLFVRSALALLLPIGLCAGAGCGSDDAPSPSAGAGSSQGGSGASTGTGASAGTVTSNGGSSSTPGGGAGSDAASPHGSVVVSLVGATDDAEGYATVLARFFDGESPDAIQLELDMEQDGCRLMVPANPFCNEPCTPAVCTADDECTPYPDPVSVGALGLEGLGDAISLEPASSMHVYQGPSLPNPPCAEGDPVTASASGFSLEADCITQLELTGPDPLPVMSGQPVSLTWVPGEAGDSMIRIGLDIAHHGGKKGEIDCEVPDTGSFEIPEPLVTRLIGLGLAGYPTIAVTRVAVGVDQDNPDVSLLLSSSVTRPVDTGVQSCQEDEQCPDGQECLDTRVCG